MVLPREEGENEACIERKQSKKKIEFLIKQKKKTYFCYTSLSFSPE
jgi:hypothetical protein